MSAADIVHALPGLLIVGLLPGFALISLLVPSWRWWERLAATPGLSAGMAGVVGLAMHDTHVPFRPATVLPLYLTVLLAVAAARHRRWRRARRPGGALTRPQELLIVGAALAAGLATTITAGISLHDRVVPYGGDTPVHAEMANAIARTNDVLPTLPSPVDQSAWVRPRSGVEAEAALIAGLGGTAAYRALAPLTLLSVLLLPLSLAMLAWLATGSVALSALAPALGVGMTFPALPLELGEYPLIVDSTIIVALIAAISRTIRNQHAGEHCVLIGVLVAAAWVVHGLEMLTVAVIGAGLVATAIAAHRRDSQLRRRLFLAGSAIVVGAVAVTVLTRVPAVPAPVQSHLSGPLVPQRTTFFTQAAGADIGSVLHFFVDSVFPVAAIAALWAAGLAIAVVRRHRLRWAAAVSVLLVACFVDSVDTGLLRRLWEGLFPWSVPDRLASIQYWLAPLLMALALVTLGDALRQLLSRTGTPRRIAAVALTVAVAVSVAAFGVQRDRARFLVAAATQGGITAADVAVIDRLSRNLVPGTAVLTDSSSDSGRWLGVLGPDVLYMPKAYLDSHPADQRLTALAGACDDPGAATSALAGVHAVYLGSKLDANDPYPWRPDCLDRVPALHLLAAAVDKQGKASAFMVAR